MCYSGVPGVEFSTGALGQGLSVSCGIALGVKLRQSDSRVYCLLGDGEIQEGQNWEAAMTASQYKLDNLCAILDQNKIQQNDFVSKIKMKSLWQISGGVSAGRLSRLTAIISQS